MQQYSKLENCVSHGQIHRVLQHHEYQNIQDFALSQPIPEGWMVYNSIAIIPLFSRSEDALLYHQTHMLQSRVDSNMIVDEFPFPNEDTDSYNRGTETSSMGYREFPPSTSNGANPSELQSKVIYNNSVNTKDYDSRDGQHLSQSTQLKIAKAQRSFDTPRSNERGMIGKMDKDESNNVENSNKESGIASNSQDTSPRFSGLTVKKDKPGDCESLEKSTIPDIVRSAGNNHPEYSNTGISNEPQSEKPDAPLGRPQESYLQAVKSRKQMDLENTQRTQKIPIRSDLKHLVPQLDIYKDESYHTHKYLEAARGEIDTTLDNTDSNHERQDLNEDQITNTLSGKPSDMSVEKVKQFLPGTSSHENLALKTVSKINNITNKNLKEVPENPKSSIVRDENIEGYDSLGEPIGSEPKEFDIKWTVVQSRRSKPKKKTFPKDNQALEEIIQSGGRATTPSDGLVQIKDSGMERKQENNNEDDEYLSINSPIASENIRHIEDEDSTNSYQWESLIQKKLETKPQEAKRKNKKHKNTRASTRLKSITENRTDNLEAKDESLDSFQPSMPSDGLTGMQDFRSIVLAVLSKVLCEHDNSNFLKIHLDHEDYNQVFSHLGTENDHHILEVWTQFNTELSKTVELEEMVRRSQTLWRYIDQEQMIVKWKNGGGKLDKATHKVAKLLKIDQRWPVFVDTTSGKWRLVKSRWDALDAKQKKALDIFMDADEQKTRLATIYVMEAAKQNWSEALYDESELQHMMRQGISIPLLFRTINLLDLNKPIKNINWKEKPLKELLKKSMGLLNVMYGYMLFAGQSYDTNLKFWPASPLRHFLLKDSRWSLHFQARLKFLVNNTHNSILPLEKLEEEEIPEHLNKILTLGEVLAASHLGISLKTIAWIKYESLLELKAIQRSASNELIEQDDKKFHWPITLLSNWTQWKHELQPYFQLLGYKVSFES
ncbi:hypothetical protein DFH28DRAFT_882610 [Melampsora americana]|nr:hypothetical protein DFH28DRAFT_882610 [Melampsora americana]